MIKPAETQLILHNQKKGVNLEYENQLNPFLSNIYNNNSKWNIKNYFDIDRTVKKSKNCPKSKFEY